MDSFTLVFFTSGSLSLLIYLTSSWHEIWTDDNSLGPQKLHSEPTPRVGGLAIFTALFGYCLLQIFQHQIAPINLHIASDNFILAFGIITLPCFIAGLSEDISKKISIQSRLLSSIASAVVALLFFKIEISSTGFALLDRIPFLLPLLTIFALSGISNAFNLIDGLNGLSSGIFITSMAAFGYLAHKFNAHELIDTCLILAAAALGFTILNWPFGKIFLGDGGAYFLGCSVGLTAILLTNIDPSISPWCALTILNYPTIETLFSFYRRRQAKKHPGYPDKLHLHSLVKRRIFVNLRRIATGHKLDLASNSIGGFACILFGSIPAIAGVIFFNDMSMLILSTLSFTLLYVFLYKLLSASK